MFLTSRLDGDEDNEFRIYIIDTFVFYTPFHCYGKVPRSHALQPQQHFPARCLQNTSVFSIFFAKSHVFMKPRFFHHCRYQILASRSWLPDPGFQILASRSRLPDLSYQILATRCCQRCFSSSRNKCLVWVSLALGSFIIN